MPSSPTVSTPPSSSATRDTTSSTWFPYRSAGDFEANLVMILIILICALVSALALNAGIRCLIRRRRRSQAGTSGTSSGKPPRAAEAEIRSLPMLIFSAGMNMAGAEAECAICLSEFVNGERIRVLPKCKHGFHVKCIEDWLASRTSCPTCRTSCLTASPEKGDSGGNDVEAPREASDRMPGTAPEV